MALKRCQKPQKRSPFAYRPGNTPLHRLNSGVKLCCLLAIASAPPLFKAPGLGVSAALIALGSILSGIKPWELLRGTRTLFVFLIFLCISRSFTGEAGNLGRVSLGFNPSGFRESLFLGGTMLASYTAGSLLFSVTTMASLWEALAWSERIVTYPLRKLLDLGRSSRIEPGYAIPGFSVVSLGLALLLSFLPRFFAIWEISQTAYRARAGKPGIEELVRVVPQTVERMIRVAAETAQAMESRGL